MLRRSHAAATPPKGTTEHVAYLTCPCTLRRWRHRARADHPGSGFADDSAPTFSRGAASTQDPNPLYAGYTSELGGTKSITGTLTLPTLGDCATDGGLLVAIELSDASGGDYVDGGSYSSCVGGVKSHSLIIESTAEGQVVIGEGEDGDKIKVASKGARRRRRRGQGHQRHPGHAHRHRGHHRRHDRDRDRHALGSDLRRWQPGPDARVRQRSA